MASSSSACYYVVIVTIPNIVVHTTMRNIGNESKPFVDIPVHIPIFTCTVLRKDVDNKYTFVQDLKVGYGGGFKLTSVPDLSETDKEFLKIINYDVHKSEMPTIYGFMKDIYSGLLQDGTTKSEDIAIYLNTEKVLDLIGHINATIYKWNDTPASASCTIAGGRRRPKKSRRSRSSRKRRQTRSK